MSYTNEIKENIDFWQKFLGTEICKCILQEETEGSMPTEEQAEETHISMLIEPCYRKSLTEKVTGESDLLPNGSFSGFYRIFIKAAYFYWNTKDTSLLENALQDIAENLYKRIEKIPLKVLIQDIHEC